MFSFYEKNIINIGFETESKTKSSSIKDEKEIPNKSNKKKKKINKIKISSISINNKNNTVQDIIKDREKIYLNEDMNENINIFKDKKSIKKNDISTQDKEINFIQRFYNLEEAYRKNKILEELRKNNELEACKINHNIKTNESLNNRNKKFNFFYLNNTNYSNNKYTNLTDRILRFNENQMVEDDYKNYTASYRDKMVVDSMIKLNRNNIEDDSLTELKSEEDSFSFFDENNGNNSQNIKKNYAKSKFNKMNMIKFNRKYNFKFINNNFKKIDKNKNKSINNNSIKKYYSKEINNDIKEENNKNISIKISNNKNKELKKYFTSNKEYELNIQKNKNNFLIKELMNKINKKKKLNLNNNNFLHSNININLTDYMLEQIPRIHKNIKNKNKRYSKNKEIINKNNKTLNEEYFINHILKKKIHKNFGIYPINKGKINYSQKISVNSKNKGCIIKSYNFNSLTSKNQKNRNLNIPIKEINYNYEFPNKNIGNNSQRTVLYNNIKNKIKNDDNKNYLNKILIKDNKNKTLTSSFLKQNKKKKNLLNKTLNCNNKELNFSVKNSIKKNNITKNNDIQNLSYNYFKNKKNLYGSHIIYSPLFEEDIFNYKTKENVKNYITKNNNNNYINITSINNKTNKKIYIKKKYNYFNINDFYNSNNIYKRKKLSLGKLFKPIKKLDK